MKVFIKLSEVDHDSALYGFERLMAISFPLAPIIKNKTPNRKNPPGILKDFKTIFPIMHSPSLLTSYKILRILSIYRLIQSYISQRTSILIIVTSTKGANKIETNDRIIRFTATLYLFGL